MENEEKSSVNGLRKFTGRPIDGMGLGMYSIMVVLLLILIRFDLYPQNILGDLFMMLVLGNLLYNIGSQVPFFNKYLGGGAVITLFGSATLAMTEIVPIEVVESVEGLLSDVKFIDFFIISLIVGSILGISSQLMAQAAMRFLPVAFMAMIITLGLLALFAYLCGFNVGKTLLFVGFPIMGGGISAGAIPLSELYASTFGVSRDYLSMILPAVILGNIVSIIVSGWISKWFENTKIDGHGELVRNQAPVKKITFTKSEATDVGVGLMIILSFYMVGTLLHAMVPVVNRYPFIIITAMIVKLSGNLPLKYERASVLFSQSITKNLSHALLAGVGLTKLNLDVLWSTVTWKLVLLVIFSVITISLVAGILGYFMGLYPLEAAITAGLVNNSMGGTGNLGVLSAANRIDLIGFAQMGNRMGGALMLVVAGGYVAFFT